MRIAVQTIENIRLHSPDVAILILADSDDEAQVIAAVGQGAPSSLVKEYFDGASLAEYMRDAIEQRELHLASD